MTNEEAQKEQKQYVIDEYGETIEKQSKEIEELKREKVKRSWVHIKENGEVEPLFYVSKEKIKAKIEELENEDKKYKNYLKDGRENFTPEYVWARPVLQSLLEKE